MKFKDVKIGTRRVTLEVHPAADAFPLMQGDEYAALVDDVRLNGFRHPIVVRDGVLVDGRNRLRVGQKLSIDPPVEHLGAKVDVLEYIISTNINRRHLTESQRAMIAAYLATLDHGANQHTRGKVTAPTQAGAAKRLQVSERSVRDAKRVIDRGDDTTIAAVKDGRLKVSAAAKLSELPKSRQRDIVERVTKGNGEVKPGKVKALARQEVKRDTIERINTGKVRPVGVGPFGVIVVDYPWPYGNSDGHEGSRGHVDYPTMSMPDICRHARVDLAKVAHDDCILGLWVTNAFIHVVGAVLDSAGFEQRSMITWDKGRAGVGTWPRGQTEHLVIASRGKPVHTLNAITTLHREPAREHSRKPDGLLDLLAQHCAGPHLELFAREERAGWVTWGAEVGKFTPRAAPADPAPAPAGAVAELDEQLAEPWTCECGHVNTFRILDGVVEVCGNCEVPRPSPPPAASEPDPGVAAHGAPRPFRLPPPGVPWNCDCGGLSGVAPHHMAGDVICQDKAARAARAAAAPSEPSLADVCPKCGRELGEHRGKKCPPPAAEAPDPRVWTCRARPPYFDGVECGRVNLVPFIEDDGIERCAKCGCVKPGHGAPGKPAKAAKPTKPATVAKHEASFQAARGSKRRPLSVPRGKEKPAANSAAADCAGCRRGGRCAVHGTRPLSVPPPAACGVRMTMGPSERGKPVKLRPPREACELAAGHHGDHRAHALSSKHIVEWKGDGSKGCVWVPIAKAAPIPELGPKARNRGARQPTTPA